MHLCMQDDQIGPKIVGFATANMARLPPSITKKKIIVNNLVCQLGLHLLWTRPALRTRKILLVLRFLWPTHTCFTNCRRHQLFPRDCILGRQAFFLNEVCFFAEQEVNREMNNCGIRGQCPCWITVHWCCNSLHISQKTTYFTTQKVMCGIYGQGCCLHT
jgi:hypothetical protein